jgi:hypothetical protein
MSDYNSDDEPITPIDFPILDLPAEITSRVFIQCLPTEFEDSPLAYTDIAPIVLTRICSKWREVALGTPELWTTLWVVGHGFRDPHQDAEAVKEYVARSGALPLELMACHRASTDQWRDDKQYADGLYALADQLRLCAPRCWSLDINFPDLTLIAPIIEELNRAKTAMLEELKIETNRSPAAESAPPLTAELPSLIHLRVFESHTRTPSIPYIRAPATGMISRLRNVSIFQHISLAEFYAWILACPELEEGHFELKIDANRSEIISQVKGRVSAGRLKLLQLHIQEHPMGAMEELPLDLLHLSSLDNLELHCPNMQAPVEDSITLDNLKTLLRQSRPPLKNLLLRNIKAPLDSITSLLQEIPQLETLDADGTFVTDELLQLLSISPISVAGGSLSAPLLPDLRVLLVDNYHSDSPDVMAAFIRSRWDTSRMVPRQQGNDVSTLDEDQAGENVPCPERQFLEVEIKTPWHTGLAENADVARCVDEGFSLNLLSPGPSSVSTIVVCTSICRRLTLNKNFTAGVRAATQAFRKMYLGVIKQSSASGAAVFIRLVS